MENSIGLLVASCEIYCYFPCLNWFLMQLIQQPPPEVGLPQNKPLIIVSDHSTINLS
jgi:hypothetical protein